MYPDNFLENSKLYNLTEEDITEKVNSYRYSFIKIHFFVVFKNTFV